MDGEPTPLTCDEHLPPRDKRVIPWTEQDAEAFAIESDAAIGLEERARLVVDACKKQARADNEGMGFISLCDADMAERIVAFLKERNYKADEYESNDANSKIGIWFGVGPCPADEDDNSVAVDAKEPAPAAKKRALDDDQSDASVGDHVVKESKPETAVDLTAIESPQ
jgi:hypothetical protein